VHKPLPRLSHALFYWPSRILAFIAWATAKSISTPTFLAFVVDFSEAPQTAIATRSGTVPQSHSCAHFLAHFIGQGRSPSNGRRPSAAPPCPSHFMPFWPVLFLDQTPLEISVSVPCLWTCQWLPQLGLGLDYLCNW